MRVPKPYMNKLPAVDGNFYAVMATEELAVASIRATTWQTIANEVNALARDGAFARALTLFKASQGGNWNMRRVAQAEWRYAIRGLMKTPNWQPHN